MSPQTSGWYNESYRHALAQKGIRSKNPMVCGGKPKKLSDEEEYALYKRLLEHEAELADKFYEKHKTQFKSKKGYIVVGASRYGDAGYDPIDEAFTGCDDQEKLEKLLKKKGIASFYDDEKESVVVGRKEVIKKLEKVREEMEEW